MNLNKLKNWLATTWAIVLMWLTIQTKAAVAETLSHNEKKTSQTEGLASIADNTAEIIGDAFVMEWGWEPDTSRIVELFYAPDLDLTSEEKIEFDILLNQAIKHKYRNIYETEILNLFKNPLLNNIEKALITLWLLSRVDTNSLTQIALTEISKNKELRDRYNGINKSIISKEKLNQSKEKLNQSKEKWKQLDIKIKQTQENIVKLKKEIEAWKKEIEAWKKEIEQLNIDQKKIDNNIETLNKLNKNLEEMEKLFKKYQK